MFGILIPAALILVSLTATVLLLSRDWRLSIGALALQYVGVFVFVAISWPVERAVVKLVTGWMAGAVLGMAMIGSPEGGRLEVEEERSFLPFRLLTVGLVGLVIYSLAPRIIPWVPRMGYGQVLGGVTLLGLGVLHLGFSGRPFRVAVGLLTVLSGFEIFYASVETSALVSGLLASVNLGIALLGAYLLTQPGVESPE